MSFKIIQEGEERTKIEVTHTCGHVQVCNPRTKHLKLGEERSPGFTERQYGWMARNLCPGCYTAAKDENPNHKPND